MDHRHWKGRGADRRWQQRHLHQPRWVAPVAGRHRLLRTEIQRRDHRVDPVGELRGYFRFFRLSARISSCLLMTVYSGLVAMNASEARIRDPISALDTSAGSSSSVASSASDSERAHSCSSATRPMIASRSSLAGNRAVSDQSTMVQHPTAVWFDKGKSRASINAHIYR